jgi:hypothetical protein
MGTLTAVLTAHVPGGTLTAAHVPGALALPMSRIAAHAADTTLTVILTAALAALPGALVRRMCRIAAMIA